MRVDRPQWLAPSLTCILSSSLKLKAALVGAEARSVEALCTLSLAACVCSVREICTQVTRQTHNGKSRGRTLKYLCAVREICVDAAHDQTCQATGHNRAIQQLVECCGVGSAHICVRLRQGKKPVHRMLRARPQQSPVKYSWRSRKKNACMRHLCLVSA